MKRIAALWTVFTLAPWASAQEVPGEGDSSARRGTANAGVAQDLPVPILAVLNKAEASVSLIDPRDGSEHRLVEVGEGPHEAAVSPDGELLVVCNYGARTPGGSLSFLSARDGSPIDTLELVWEPTPDPPSDHSDGAPPKRIRLLRPHGIRFVDPRFLVVTSEVRRQLAIVDATERRVTAVLPTDAAGSHMVAVHHHGGGEDGALGARAYVANISSGSLSVLDLVDRRLVKVVETGAGSEGVEVTPDGREVWVSNRAEDTLSIVDTASLQVVATLRTAGFPIRVAFTPDGSKALVSCAGAGTVEVFDTSQRTLVKSIAMNEEPLEDVTSARLFSGRFGESPVPFGLLVRPDGREAFVANTQADVITVLDLQELRIARRLITRSEPDGMAWIDR